MRCKQEWCTSKLSPKGEWQLGHAHQMHMQVNMRVALIRLGTESTWIVGYCGAVVSL